MQQMSGGANFSREEIRLAKKSSRRSWFSAADAPSYIYGAVGFIIIALVMRWLQYSTPAICCGDFDGYYHIRWSQLLWQNFSQFKGLPDFPWLPLTVLSTDSYADHHFLFHLLQIPFLWFFEPITAAKVAAVVFATLAVFSCYWLVLHYKINYPLVWLLGLLTCSSAFYYRMNMAKAPPIAIIFTIIGIYLLFERRYVWLLPLTFAFVWAYSFYPIVVVAAIAWAVILYWNDSKIEWQPVVYSAVGAIAGNIINPYFPRNLWLFLEHAATKLPNSGGADVPVGGEWYPYDSKMLLGSCAIAFLAMLIGYILYQPSEKRLDEKATLLLVLASGLMLAVFQSKRYAEYFPPLAILFAAFAAHAFARRSPDDALLLPEEFSRDLQPYLDKQPTLAANGNNHIWQNAFVGLITVLLLVNMFLTLRGFEIESRHINYKGLVKDLQDNEPPDRFQTTMEWAVANIPEFDENGQRIRIFNTDWDDFPKAFYHDQKHAYIAGLDPKYLHSRNPELWDLYAAITTGKTDESAPIIKDKFGARYIFSDNAHDDFYAKIMQSGWVDKIYQGDDSMILKIRDQKGEPPAEVKPNDDKKDDKNADDAKDEPDDEDNAEAN